VSVIIQQDATIYSLFISENCCTCFGWYLHPSSGAHITVPTVTGIVETATTTYLQVAEDGRNYRPKYVELIEIINKLLLLHLVAYVLIY